MAELQWLAMAVVSVFAIIATIFFGMQNLRRVILQYEYASGYASGRIEAKLDNLEHALRAINKKLDANNEKNDASNALLDQMNGRLKKQNRRLHKLAP